MERAEMKIEIYTDGISKELEDNILDEFKKMDGIGNIRKIVTKELIFKWKPFKFLYNFGQERRQK